MSNKLKPFVRWPKDKIGESVLTPYKQVRVFEDYDKQLLASALIGYQRLLAQMNRELNEDSRLDKLRLMKSNDNSLAKTFSGKDAGNTGFKYGLFSTKDSVKRFWVYGSTDGSCWPTPPQAGPCVPAASCTRRPCRPPQPPRPPAG